MASQSVAKGPAVFDGRCILPYTNAAWEKRSIFRNFLISKLPAQKHPKEEDLSKGILDAIDMDSYRIEKRAVQRILLPASTTKWRSTPSALSAIRSR